MCGISKEWIKWLVEMDFMLLISISWVEKCMVDALVWRSNDAWAISNILTAMVYWIKYKKKKHQTQRHRNGKNAWITSNTCFLNTAVFQQWIAMHKLVNIFSYPYRRSKIRFLFKTNEPREISIGVIGQRLLNGEV